MAVEKPTNTSPLPCPQMEPQRARPAPARLTMRRSWRLETGRSVATMTMQLPLSGASSRMRRSISRPTGCPPICRSARLPWFVCASTPSVKRSLSISRTREAEPTPPFRPWQVVPLPQPTPPSAKSARAASMAANTCSRVTARSRMSLSDASLHSHTTGLSDVTAIPSASQRRKVYSTSASCTMPTFSVFVSAMGVSSVPSSSTCTSPSVFPKPFSTKDAATDLFVNGFSAQGSTTVTPVLWRALSIVACPTRTPGTSARLSSAPEGRRPMVSPMSRAFILFTPFLQPRVPPAGVLRAEGGEAGHVVVGIALAAVRPLDENHALLSGEDANFAQLDILVGG